MFRHEGPARSPAKNAALAAYLALVGGFVNSGGFILVGSFTSHVTGNVGRLSVDLVRMDATSGLIAATFVGSFFVGAFGASLILESDVFRRPSRAYACALLTEALLLGIFIIVYAVAGSGDPSRLRAEPILLSMAMGVQNSLVTRLSGAVVRTTHLTGIVTDLGIEAARWVRFAVRGGRTSPTSRAPSRPDANKTFLLSTILVGFTVGAVLGAALTLTSRWAMLLPLVATLGGSLYAFVEPED